MNRHVFTPVGFEVFDDLIVDAFQALDLAWQQSKPNLQFPPANVSVLAPEGQLQIELAVAGYDPSTIEVRSDDNRVIVEAKNAVSGDEDVKVIYRGIKGSNFRVWFPIPDKFDLGKIEALFKNGLLTITIPVMEGKKPKAISVKVAE
jgi:HSP20 family protein